MTTTACGVVLREWRQRRHLSQLALALKADVSQRHEPFPALAIDRHWTLLMANGVATALLGGISGSLLEPPINVVRLTLHPDGLAPRILNLEQWRVHVLERVSRSAALSADQVLVDLVAELRSYPVPRTRASGVGHAPMHDGGDVFVPLQLDTDFGVLSLISTTTVFGTPVDVTLAEMALECFFPADAETAERLRGVAALRADAS